MSIIVLNSKGQDPAEWENHFGRGIKLPQNAEICLLGSNLNFKLNSDEETTIHEGNDTFVVQYGNVETQNKNESGGYTMKIKHGTYKNFDLGAMIADALQNGNFHTPQISNAYFSNQPISPLRGGISCDYDTTSLKMDFSARRYTIGENNISDTQQDRFTSDKEASDSFYGSYGRYLNNETLEDDRAPNPWKSDQLVVWGLDPTFAVWLPPNADDWNQDRTTLALLHKYPIWTHSTGAPPLLPDGGFWGGQPNVNRYWNQGHHWVFSPVLQYENDRDKLKVYMGGIVSQKRVGMVGWAPGNANSGNNTANRQNFENWALGGMKYDIWWEIHPDDANNRWLIKFYYHPMNTTRWDYTNRVQFGEAFTVNQQGGVVGDLQISLIPKNGKCGTDANAPQLPGADADKFIWEGRVAMSTSPQTQGGSSSVPATANSFPGYVAVTDGGNFDIYKHLPLFYGTNVKEPRPVIAGSDITVAMSPLRHQNTQLSLMSIYNGQPEPLTGGSGSEVIANNELPFRSVYLGFSPTREINDIIAPFIDHKFRNMVDRYANVGRTIGMREDTLHSIPAESSADLESDFPAPDWNETAEVAIIQLPNLPVEGSLGAGNNVYGGANDAQILGIAPINIMYQRSNERGQYNETTQENWIKLKNLTMDSLNQLCVKITDVTGRKLKNLSPNSTVWIKIRQGMEDRTLKAGDGDKCYKVPASNFYNKYT